MSDSVDTAKQQEPEQIVLPYEIEGEFFFDAVEVKKKPVYRVLKRLFGRISDILHRRRVDFCQYRSRRPLARHRKTLSFSMGSTLSEIKAVSKSSRAVSGIVRKTLPPK